MKPITISEFFRYSEITIIKTMFASIFPNKTQAEITEYADYFLFALPRQYGIYVLNDVEHAPTSQTEFTSMFSQLFLPAYPYFKMKYRLLNDSAFSDLATLNEARTKTLSDSQNTTENKTISDTTGSTRTVDGTKETTPTGTATRQTTGRTTGEATTSDTAEGKEAAWDNSEYQNDTENTAESTGTSDQTITETVTESGGKVITTTDDTTITDTGTGTHTTTGRGTDTRTATETESKQTEHDKQFIADYLNGADSLYLIGFFTADFVRYFCRTTISIF